MFAQYTPYPGVGFWWLPFTGVFIVLLSLYVDGDIRRLEKEIERLEKMKYPFKKV